MNMRSAMMMALMPIVPNSLGAQTPQVAPADPASACKSVTVVGTPSPLFCKGTNRQKFIADLYALALKRQAATPEIIAWDQSSLGTKALAGAFVQTPEYQQSLVNIIYRWLLSRDAGPDERKYWATQGDFRNTVINVLGSQEFMNKVGNDDDAFITAVYSLLTGSAPTDAQRADANDLFSQGDQMYPTFVANLYDTSATHLQLVNGTCGLYQTILDRQGEAAGVAFWVKLMDGSPSATLTQTTAVAGVPYERIQAGFLGSQEMLTRSHKQDPQRFCPKT